MSKKIKAKKQSKGAQGIMIVNQVPLQQEIYNQEMTGTEEQWKAAQKSFEERLKNRPDEWTVFGTFPLEKNENGVVGAEAFVGSRPSFRGILQAFHQGYQFFKIAYKGKVYEGDELGILLRMPLPHTPQEVKEQMYNKLRAQGFSQERAAAVIEALEIGEPVPMTKEDEELLKAGIPDDGEVTIQ